MIREASESGWESRTVENEHVSAPRAISKNGRFIILHIFYLYNTYFILGKPFWCASWFLICAIKRRPIPMDVRLTLWLPFFVRFRQFQFKQSERANNQRAACIVAITSHNKATGTLFLFLSSLLAGNMKSALIQIENLKKSEKRRDYSYFLKCMYKGVS